MPSNDPTPDATPGAPPCNCEEAAVLTSSVATGTLEREAVLRLRRHLAQCRPCMGAYREAVETTAQLGRFTLEEREKRMLERQRRARHARAFKRREKPDRGSGRGFRLRLILMPAAFIYIVMKIAGIGPAPARVELVERSGPVTIDLRTVEHRSDAPLVLPGRWVNAGPKARARLDGGACVVDLREDTSLLLESARPVRFRFPRGRVRVEGDVTFVTVLGVLELREARGRLTFDDEGLVLEPEAGTWTLVDRRGERALPLGRATTVLP